MTLDIRALWKRSSAPYLLTQGVPQRLVDLLQELTAKHSTSLIHMVGAWRQWKELMPGVRDEDSLEDFLLIGLKRTNPKLMKRGVPPREHTLLEGLAEKYYVDVSLVADCWQRWEELEPGDRTEERLEDGLLVALGLTNNYLSKRGVPPRMHKYCEWLAEKHEVGYPDIVHAWDSLEAGHRGRRCLERALLALMTERKYPDP